MPIIQARSVSKSFARKQALDGVSISVPEASIYGLLGPNGAGKTTLIRILTQIIGPDSGSILFDGRPLVPADISRIGYMPEERGLYRKMKVGEQLLYFSGLKGVPRKAAVEELRYWFSIFHIEDWWNKKVEELSKGMQQKVQFISTVIHKPQVIILDEPFTGFDPVNSAIIKDEIVKMKERGATIILSTHRMESVEELCDHFALINKAQKIIEGPVNAIRHQFKEHSFEIVLGNVKGTLPLQDTTDYLLEEKQDRPDGTVYLRFKVAENIPTNQVLQKLIPYGDICSFKEVLPTINDIFIRLVKEEPHA